MKTNVLYFGDNLEILRNREYFPDNSVDLIYLDPPFNSKKDYNILFKENGGVESEAQIKAFTDTWHWTPAAENTYHEIVTQGPLKVGKLIGALHDAIGNNDVMAYLVMMTARLIELHRVLKSTGSLYLHCDPTASHYLKLVLDQIFGPANFRNEIVWHHQILGTGLRAFPRQHEVLLRYTRSIEFKFKPEDKLVRVPFSKYILDTLQEDEHGYYYTRRRMTRKATADELARKAGTKTYVNVEMGRLAGDVWSDFPSYQPKGAERLGYPTQKPLELLERIIAASSDEGDIVLDPFCGCGTAIVAAHKLKRKWIDIDITHLAINLMKNRLKDSFPKIKFEVIGEPADLAGAKALAHQDRYQFQWWALGLIGARPLGEKKKGADKGIDGVIHFIDEVSGKPKRVVVQVKSGHVAVNAVRELETVAKNDAIGVLITLEPPTSPMEVEAVSAGYYHSPIWDKDYPKIQILTIEELLHGKTVDMPPQTQTSVTFAKAPKVSKKEGEQLPME